MTAEEHREHDELHYKWGCSDITLAQLERLAELDALAGGGGGFSSNNPSTAEKGHNESALP